MKEEEAQKDQLSHEISQLEKNYEAHKNQLAQIDGQIVATQKKLSEIEKSKT